MSERDAQAHQFLWIDQDEPVLGGQWMAVHEDEGIQPVVLADVVAARRDDVDTVDPLPVHVDATLRVVRAAGDLEDELFPDTATRLYMALYSDETASPVVEPDTHEGERVRRGAEALEKLAADLAELVEDQLDGGSLAHLPADSTRALCQATQTAWRLRRLVDPPSPLYL